ncbi:MAG: LysR family transcriptional regulator [Ilumatobacteraceae bacterium]
MAWGASAPTLVDLDLFVTVLDVGSLSRAAAVHHISQPAASGRLRGLERRLGVQLLDRRSSGSTPTAEGLAVAVWARDVLVALGVLMDGVDALHTGTDRLRVIASYTIAEHLLPRWLSVFHRANPNVGTELRVANSATVADALRAGTADVGFVEGPQQLGDLNTLDVAVDELVIVAAPDHPWSRRRRPLSMRSLAAAALVVRESGSGTRETLDLVFGRHGLRGAPPALELGSTVAVKSAVLAGVGPAVLSRLAVEAELADGRLVAVDLEGEPMVRTLRAVWSRAAVPSAGALALLRQLGLPRPGRRAEPRR